MKVQKLANGKYRIRPMINGRQMCFTFDYRPTKAEIDKIIIEFNYMQKTFFNCQKLSSLNLSHFDTINVKSMESMFEGCVELRHLNLENFNTSSCSNFKRMFEYCDDLEIIVDYNATINMIETIDKEKIHVINKTETEV